MLTSELISIVAILVSGLSALYARWAVKEATKSNELNRFKALLELKSSYLVEMDNQLRAAKEWGRDDSFTEACRNKHADIDSKYREVCKELEVYHLKLIKNEI